MVYVESKKVKSYENDEIGELREMISEIQESKNNPYNKINRSLMELLSLLEAAIWRVIILLESNDRNANKFVKELRNMIDKLHRNALSIEELKNFYNKL